MQRKIELEHINPFLTCPICKGYLVDATTIVECLHSFCRGCIIRHLESSYNCPKCNTEIHKTKPFEYIRSDPSLQEIVYKLVPELYQNEEIRKQDWKKQEKTNSTREELTDEKDEDESEDHRILVTLKYFRGTSRMERIKTERVLQMFPTRYLCCQPELPVRVLKKFVQYKFDISTDLFKLEMWRGDETLLDELTLKQLVQIYGLYRERKPLELHYSLYPKFETKTNEEINVKPAIPRPPFPSSQVIPKKEDQENEEDEKIKQEEIQYEESAENKESGGSPLANKETSSNDDDQSCQQNQPSEETQSTPPDSVESSSPSSSETIKQEEMMETDDNTEHLKVKSPEPEKQDNLNDRDDVVVSENVPESREQSIKKEEENSMDTNGDEKPKSDEPSSNNLEKNEKETTPTLDSSETNTSYESCQETLSSQPDKYDTPMETED